MKCPICDHANVGEALRCPKCQSPLTLWKNFDAYGHRAYRAGLHALGQGSPAAAAEHLLRAVIFAPEAPGHLDAYGRVLGQLGRYAEAAVVLDRACRLAPGDETRRAREKAEALARSGPDNPRAARPFLPPPDPAAGAADDGPWRLALHVEEHWGRFAALAAEIEALPDVGGELGAAVAYVRGLAAFRRGDDRAARAGFDRACDAGQDHARRPAAYLLLSAGPEGVSDGLDALRMRGLDDGQLGAIVGDALRYALEHRREWAMALLGHALRLGGTGRDQLGDEVARWCWDEAELAAACEVLGGAITGGGSWRLALILGDLRVRLGQLDAALAAWDRPLTLADLPDDGRFELQRRRAELLERLGRRPEAVAAGEALRALRPDDPGVGELLETARRGLESTAPPDEAPPDDGSLVAPAADGPPPVVPAEPRP